jgi:Helix-turn-helix domain
LPLPVDIAALEAAPIVLLAAAGRSTRSIAKEVGVQPRIVSLWRHRYADLGLEGLQDKPRPRKQPIDRAARASGARTRSSARSIGSDDRLPPPPAEPDADSEGRPSESWEGRARTTRLGPLIGARARSRRPRSVGWNPYFAREVLPALSWVPSASARVLFWSPGVFLGGTGKIRIYFIAINFQRVEAAGTTGNFGK